MGSSSPNYVKTPKGIEEFEKRSFGLDLKSRQVLIMINGKRDLVALQAIFPPEMVLGIVKELSAGGFIREIEKPKPVSTPVAEPAQEEAFELGQTFMINIAKRVLGIAGDGVIAKLKGAKTLDDLRGLFIEWRTAIKQSPDGLQRMKEIENKLSHVLGELPVPDESAAKSVSRPAATPKQPGNDEERFVMARNFMVNTSRTYLGIAANSFIAKVEATDSIEALRHLFFEWRESLKQSPESKRRLAEFESKLAALLS